MDAPPGHFTLAPRLVARACVLALVLGVLSLVSITPAEAAGDPCGPTGNAIACENSKPGSPPSQWDVDGAGSETIQGFATDISVDRGGQVDLKIDTSARAYTIDIYRLGYYGGLGARKIDSVTPSAPLPQSQPQCITDATTQLFDCGNWARSASWSVPSTAVSGVYVARLRRTDTGAASHVTFVVRDDASRSDVVFQTSDPTWQAYNTYGGSNFYTGGANGRAYKLSYNRPFSTRDGTTARDFFFANEFPAVRFLEKNGYDTSYIAGVDTDRSGALLKNHKAFLSVGHDEYWSGAQRKNVEAARDAGVNLQFLSGNEVYWRTRYEPSADASKTPYRTLVTYKETWDNAKTDPEPQWTGTWRDPRFAPTSQGGGSPENALTGTMYKANFTDLALQVPAAQGKNRLWRNTTVAGLAAGQTATLAPHTVGYESNEDVDNGHRPAGLVRMSTTTGPTPEYLTDYGSTVVSGTTTHSTTLYRAPSGALVFSAGTVQWSWGLDGTHDSPYADQPADPRMQQAQVNLLADMSAQPTTLDPALTPATASSDATGPTTSIDAPAAGAKIANGTKVALTGTATDNGGGVVAGVEVSTDDGATWHPATGTTSWSYSYSQRGSGATPVRVRAIDDSANIGAVATRSYDVSCPCSVYGSDVPTNPSVSDTSAVELGLRFSPTTDGFVNGVRFYKGTKNTGTHVGTLWSAAGTPLANVTFTGESASGWQSATFSEAVPVTAGTTYVVSYTAPNGGYAADKHAFAESGIDARPLKVAGGFGTQPAGVYGNTGRFPDTSFQSSSYGVDVLYTTYAESPLTAGSQFPLAGSSSVPTSATVGAVFSKPLTPGSQGLVLRDATGATVPGATAYDTTTRRLTFTPSSPLAAGVRFTAALSGKDEAGKDVTSGAAWSFTTAKPAAAVGVCPCTLYDDATQPAVLDAGETRAVTLGTRFTATANGNVTGLRFYKAPGNTGSHVGTLWSGSGTQLATGTFTGESTSGWQTLTFASPVQIAKNTPYVVSYRSTTGSFSLVPGGFSGTSNPSRGPLVVSGDAGTFNYANAFPTAATSTSYLVDPVFEKLPPSIAVEAQDPAPGATDVPRSTSVRTWFSDPVASSGWDLTLSNGSTPVAGSASLSGDGTTVTFTPAATLPAGATLTARLTGVVSREGASLPAQTWSFTTSTTDPATQQSLFSNQVPTNPSVNESSPIELGTVITPARSGQITAVRFYKGAGNGGTHTGSVWSMSGQRLATVTFSGETPSGWQTAKLSTPVTVAAGTSYVVSYYAPQGHYSATANLFKQPLLNGDLAGPSGANGRYLYSASGGFPTQSYASTSYFVDVVYTADKTPLQVTDRNPNPGATGITVGVKPSVTFNVDLAGGRLDVAASDGTTVAGTSAMTSDKRTLVFTPSAPLRAATDYTVTAESLSSTEGVTAPASSWSFTTEAAGSSSVSLFGDLVPATAAANDGSAIELGTAFTSSVAGSATGVRFYKGTANTGTHVGSLWDANGNRLASVTFTGETASGWQSATFATPVRLTPGTTYVVSYYAPVGRYSVTSRFFNTPWTSGALTAPATSNGRYRYGSGGGFPTGSYNATNYFVDLMFRPDN